VTLYINDAAKDINCDRCQLTFTKKLFKHFEVKFSEHLRRLEDEIV